uniref:Peptide-N(4)-(N-acetyl-beta-glucosaminyl)asparagine amidase n=1 Tax=Aegilops tauschii TaxID=37682 RepID=M8AX26_AEGTA
MVARRFLVRQVPADEEHTVEYDTEDGLDVLRFQIFSLTSVPPDLQKIVVEADGSVVDDGTDLESIPEGLCLMSIDEGEDADAASALATAQEKSDEELARLIEIEVEADGSVVDDGTDLESISEVLRLVPIGEGDDVDAAAAAAARAQEKSDEELARMIQVRFRYDIPGCIGWSSAAEEEALLLQQYSIQSDGGEVFRERVEPYMRQVLKYEDPLRQEAALKTVPVDELKEKALISLAKMISVLCLIWFHESNYRWEDRQLKIELIYASSLNIDAYLCKWVNVDAYLAYWLTVILVLADGLMHQLVTSVTVKHLWCNHCSSITRFPRYNDPHKILDFTDHVWTECFSNLYGRWIHLDPCEGVYDNPLLYEKGWNKKLDYAIGISKDGVHDITKRYTRKWHEVLSRRTITSEDTVSAILMNITRKCRSGLSSDELLALENRDRKESEELSKATYLEVNNSISLPGRQSGSVEWRAARSELGQADSLSCSSCPIRRCVDAHVSKIYDALSAILSHFCDNNIPNERIIEVFVTLRSLMQNLKDANFKSRRVTLDQKLQQIFEILPSAERLLSAISLKAELHTVGDPSVATDGNLIHTSLALPVALDAVDEILSNYKSNIFYTKGHQFPRGNRLCSGSVLASSEQLPIGIATAAFDGIRLSKWEEPDGAKGCWLMYKVHGGQTCELESYDLMSANDAPERDPMDWVLEGSTDQGSTWNTIDARSSVIFGSRFCRKSFTVDKRYKANVLRFRFLRGRESSANPRFQIGSIDFYGETHMA